MFIERPTRVLVLPAEAPPSQVVLSFSRLEDGEQRTLTWAPEQTQGLGREQLLEPGCWQLGWSATSMRAPQNPLIDRAWQPDTAFMPTASCGVSEDGTLTGRLLGCAQMSVQRGLLGQAQSVAKVPILLLRAPKLPLTKAIGQWRSTWSGPGLSQHVEQLAKPKTLEAKAQLSAKLQDLSGFVLLKAQDKAMEAARLRMQGALRCDAGRPFPQTCDLLGVVRLADLLVLGDTLEEILFADLILYASRTLSKKLKLEAVGSGILTVSLELAASFARQGKRPTDQEVAGHFIAMTDVYAQALVAKDPDPVTLGAGLAMAIMGECARARDCSGQRVGALLRDREAYFELGQSADLSGSWWSERDLLSFIGKGLAILLPTKVDASIERAMAISELTFALVPRHQCHKLGATSLEDCAQKHPKLMMSFRASKNLIDGAILRDSQRGLMALNEILSSSDQERRAMAALGSFLIQAPADDLKDAKQAMAARQRSMQELVEALAERSSRRGELIFGVHGATALNMIVASRDLSSEASPVQPAVTRATSTGEVFTQPLSLSFGLSGQRYFSDKIGASLALDLIELGRWASFVDGELNEFSFASAIYPALTLGVLVGDADLPIFIGAKAGYGPLDERFFIGANIGVYVPLLDFN